MLHGAQKHVVNDYIDFDMLLASFNIFFGTNPASSVYSNVMSLVSLSFVVMLWYLLVPLSW